MANLYRKPMVVVDPRTGARTKTKSKKWWGQFKDANGRLRRHPLAVDKLAAQAMLNELVRLVEREKAGLTNPSDREWKRPLVEQLGDFKSHLINKGVTLAQQRAACGQILKMAASAGWKITGDIAAASALEFLGQLRRDGRSAQTYNHYLKSAKQFTRWLAREKRLPEDPLATLTRLNVAIDRRHDRRALSADEFSLLIEAAKAGPAIEGISGADRAMLYILAAWTGFRKAELGSLTLRSFSLDANPPTATVAACHSKRRREDTQVLHPELVATLRAWLATKKPLDPRLPLFPIVAGVPGGTGRKTHKMIARDLVAARKNWIASADSPDERLRRDRSAFLTHRDDHGRYADFHSLRHFFITSLSRAGISPKIAQTLARHSDIRLTLNIYTHVALSDQTAAIAALPGPPGGG